MQDSPIVDTYITRAVVNQIRRRNIAFSRATKVAA
jgi:hypothetical protein